VNETIHTFEPPRMRIAELAPAPYRALLALGEAVGLTDPA